MLKTASILIVDDTPENLKVLGDLLKSERYDLRIATNGRQAMEIIKKSQIDLILLDVMMPELNGYEVCHSLKQDPLYRDIPVIFISALGEGEQKLNAFREGAVDYITKPFYAEEVLARVKTNVENKIYRDNLKELVRLQTRQIYHTQEATIASMALLAEYRDNETGGHIQRTKQYVKILAAKLNELHIVPMSNDEIELLALSSPLHDIGKVGLPDSILLKNGPLTSDEFDLMKQHAVIGRKVIERTIEFLGPNSFLNYAKELTGCHHEKWDGSGYPAGLKGEEIPLSARIIALADVYDALRSPRVYKQALSHEEAVRIITQGDGRTKPEHFDPTVLRAFVEVQRYFDAIISTIH